MRRTGGLFEGAVTFPALCAAARRAARGKGKSASAARFLFDLEPEVLRLMRELEDGSYRPGSYRSFVLADPKPRTISAAPFRDRVVHHAVCAVLEPVFERSAVFDSYACRRGKGQRAALRRVQHFARRSQWYLKLDVQKYFENVDHAILKALLRRRLKDARLLALLDRMIEAGAPGSPAGRGLPIGNLTSQHFANFYLEPLDHFIQEELRPRGWCRYMDDFVLLSGDRDPLVAAHAAIDRFLRERLQLCLKRAGTLLLPVRDGVPFLGFRIWPRLVRFDAARARRFRARVRALERRWLTEALDEETKARSAQSLFGWAMHGDTREFRRSFLARLRRDGILTD